MTTRLRPTRRGQVVAAALAVLLVIALAQLLTPSGTARSVVLGDAAPKLQVVESFQATATYYGPGLPADAVTASGEAFDPQAATAAHPTLPFDTVVRVTRPETGGQVVVRINDRLPDADRTRIDLTLGAARVLGMVDAGRVPVTLDVLG